MNTINELDAVALTCDQPEHGLVRGDVGTAVLVHGNGVAFEVELDVGCWMFKVRGSSSDVPLCSLVRSQ
jgi:hypothetical protein